MWKLSAFVVLLALAVAPGFWAQSKFDVSTLPEGPLQAKVGTACLECHDAGIIQQQRLSKGTWTKEVDKMTKWGATVDPKDRDAIIDYLTTNFGVDQAPYVAPRSTKSKK